MKKQNGFSLIEVMVALGLMSLVFAISGYQAYQMSLMQKKLTETAENITGTTFAENFLWEKLRTSGVSFNVAVVPDDSGRNFYDFNGDVPESLVPADRRERRLTISNDPGKPTDFFLFTYDFTESPTAIFDPAKAYNLAETSATTASLRMVLRSQNSISIS